MSGRSASLHGSMKLNRRDLNRLAPNVFRLGTLVSSKLTQQGIS